MNEKHEIRKNDKIGEERLAFIVRDMEDRHIRGVEIIRRNDSDAQEEQPPAPA